MRRFADRADAGRRLAEALAKRELGGAIVFGLARGGVAVAAEVADALGLELDALVVRKIGHPFQPEYALGAVVAGGPPVVLTGEGLGAEELSRLAGRAACDAAALDRRLHSDGGRSPRGRTCVLVDDGLATGATMLAALRWAREAGAAAVVVAVPVGAESTVSALRAEADEVVCAAIPRRFRAVGSWYEDFREVSDAEVVDLLRRHRSV